VASIVSAWTSVEPRSIRPRASRRADPPSHPEGLSESEVELLLSAVVGEDPRALRDRAILETLYATGMRISELAGLRLGDLDTRQGLAVAYGKGSKERLVPIGRQALSALEAWLGSEGRNAMAPARWARRVDAEAVFISTRGRRMSRQAVWQVVRTAAVKVKLEDRGDAPRAPALLCHTPARARRGHSRGAGAARARDHHDNAGLHEGLA